MHTKLTTDRDIKHSAMAFSQQRKLVNQTSPFLLLPAELRNIIYELVIGHHLSLTTETLRGGRSKGVNLGKLPMPPITQTCKRLRKDTLSLLLGLLGESPWLIPLHFNGQRSYPGSRNPAFRPQEDLSPLSIKCWLRKYGGKLESKGGLIFIAANGAPSSRDTNIYTAVSKGSVTPTTVSYAYNGTREVREAQEWLQERSKSVLQFQDGVLNVEDVYALVRGWHKKRIQALPPSLKAEWFLSEEIRSFSEQKRREGGGRVGTSATVD